VENIKFDFDFKFKPFFWENYSAKRLRKYYFAKRISKRFVFIENQKLFSVSNGFFLLKNCEIRDD
jgi:hypothetical protein